MIVIVLLLMLIIAFLGCLVRKDLRHSMIFAFPIIIIIGMCLWLFTLLPVQWGLKRMPFVEQAQIRDVSANDYDIKCNYPICDGVIEFVTDKKLDDCEIILEGSYKRNLSYNDFMNNDSLVMLGEKLTYNIKTDDAKMDGIKNQNKLDKRVIIILDDINKLKDEYNDRK